MKKKIVAFMLCALTVVPMAACGGKTPKEPQKNIELSRLVNGFETLGGYYSFEANYGFGAVRQNTDAAFVTEGSASLLLDVSGDFRDGSEKPSIGIALSENGSAVDLKKLKSLTFDMFNQTEEEQTVEISLTVDGVEVGKTEQKLAVGKNSIRYAPETRGLSVSGDLTKGESVNITFPLAERGASARRFYMDNLVLNENIRERAPLAMDLDENEFCSFDKDWQAYINGTEAVGPCADCMCTFSIENDIKYCKDNTGKSLKVVMPTGTPPLSDGWPCLTFLPSLVQKFDWKALKESNAEIVFDVYNPLYKAQSFTFQLWNSPTYAETHFPTNKVGTWQTSFTAGHGWTQVRIPLGDIDRESEEKPESKPLLLSDHVTAAAISYGKFAEADKTFWFDDFRFEIPQAEQD